MFEKSFSRGYEMHDFPHFVPTEELEYNIEYATRMVSEKWIELNWREKVERDGWKRNAAEAEKIASHGGMILEICAGPGAGYVPSVLMKDYNAHIMISDLCPTVVREWYHHFNQMNNPPPNVEYAAFNLCDLPFMDNSLDVVSGKAAIINIEGDRDKALKEIYRVLKPGGLFVFDYIFVTKEFYDQMEPHLQKAIKEKYPDIFWDALNVFDELGYSEIETIAKGEWNNKDDDSVFADYCRSLNTSVTFSGFVRYCTK